MMILRRLTSFLLINVICFSTIAFGKNELDLKSLRVQQVMLPSEVENVPKLSGSVYYNKSVKGKVLIPVNYWGQVARAGLHFVPAETNFISGLSMAGGPSTQSKLDNIKLIRKTGNELTVTEFNLTHGGDAESYSYMLKPNDTIFVERSTFYEDRAYYTGLISVFVTVISGYVLYTQINK